MIPLSIFSLIFAFSLGLLLFGIVLRQPWARLFGGILLMASGIILLYTGGIQTSTLVQTIGDTITYVPYGIETASNAWLFSFGTAIIFIGFITLFWGSKKAHKVDPFFS